MVAGLTGLLCFMKNTSMCAPVQTHTHAHTHACTHTQNTHTHLVSSQHEADFWCKHWNGPLIEVLCIVYRFMCSWLDCNKAKTLLSLIQFRMAKIVLYYLWVPNVEVKHVVTDVTWNRCTCMHQYFSKFFSQLFPVCSDLCGAGQWY